MFSAQNVRLQLETALNGKIHKAFTPASRAPREVTSSGSKALDQVLNGGLPLSSITEFVGLECSGRTTAAMAYIAALTQAGNVCAWIDITDALDPLTAAANDINFERLLWVRCGPRHRSPEITGFGKCRHVASFGSQQDDMHSGNPHPRGSAMPQAVGALLHAHGGLYDRQVRREKKSIGTPGVPNRPLSWRSEDREEQPNSDRLPPRRGDNLAPPIAVISHFVEPGFGFASSHSDDHPLSSTSASLNLKSSFTGKPWQALDQALRATDLLLQGGGFNTVVLDLGSTPPEISWRIPLATWFRFRAACERTRVSLLLLTQHPCARSSAELVVRMEVGTMESRSKVMTGVRYRMAAERKRFHEKDHNVVEIRKPPQSGRPGEWKSEAVWAQLR